MKRKPLQHKVIALRAQGAREFCKRQRVMMVLALIVGLSSLYKAAGALASGVLSTSIGGSIVTSSPRSYWIGTLLLLSLGVAFVGFVGWVLYLAFFSDLKLHKVDSRSIASLDDSSEVKGILLNGERSQPLQLWGKSLQVHPLFNAETLDKTKR